MYPQSREEPVLVLNRTVDPAALFERQPRALPFHQLEPILGSLNPSTVLACSHVALSVIQPPPSSSVHLPDSHIVGANPTKSVPSALH